MKNRFFFASAVLCFATFSAAIGPSPLLVQVRQELDLAKSFAARGDSDRALAHAAIVRPDHPLRVRVDCPGMAAADQGEFRNALNGAFSMWEAAIGERVFVVDETTAPDVTIHFLADVSDRGSEVCGHSCWTRQVVEGEGGPEVEFAADLEVRTVQPKSHRRLSYEQLRACVAHELGHVLGLDDVSRCGALMGPMDFRRPVTSISAEEVESLLEARRQAEILARSFPQASVHHRYLALTSLGQIESSPGPQDRDSGSKRT